jgi:hypothetical protein
LASTTDSAVSKAIASSKDRKGDPIFFPYEGTIFNSYEEGKEFYNLYSWEIGFGIRESRSKTNSNGYTTRKDIVCSCEVNILATFHSTFVIIWKYINSPR